MKNSIDNVYKNSIFKQFKIKQLSKKYAEYLFCYAPNPQVFLISFGPQFKQIGISETGILAKNDLICNWILQISTREIENKLLILQMIMLRNSSHMPLHRPGSVDILQNDILRYF